MILIMCIDIGFWIQFQLEITYHRSKILILVALWSHSIIYSGVSRLNKGTPCRKQNVAIVQKAVRFPSYPKENLILSSYSNTDSFFTVKRTVAYVIAVLTKLIISLKASSCQRNWLLQEALWDVLFRCTGTSGHAGMVEWIGMERCNGWNCDN